MATLYDPPTKPPFHPLDMMFVVVMAVIAALSLRMVIKAAIYFLYC